MNFEGKNILIVGGSSGIGLSLVKLLVANKANVYNISRKPANEWPQGVNHLSLDIFDDLTAADSFLPEQIHGLVYLVGSIDLKPFARITEEDFMNDYRLNVVGAFRIIQKTVKLLKSAAGSSIVLMSSVAARTGMSFHASIASSKSAVEGMALALAAELSQLQVRVNVVAPSLTDTPLAGNLLSTPEKREAAAKRHPLNRFGNPDDISAAIAYLLSNDSSWVTGQVIGVDGGMGKLKV